MSLPSHVFLFYVLQQPRWHDLALGAVVSLIQNGGVSPDSVVIRTSVGDLQRTLYGREILSRYKHLGVRLMDCGNLEHERGVAKVLAMEGVFAAGADSLVIVDVDTFVMSPVDMNAWVKRLLESGVDFANYKNPEDAASEYVKRVGFGPYIPGLTQMWGVEAKRRDVLYQSIFGFTEAEFVNHLRGNNWAYGGVWFARSSVRHDPNWRGCLELAWFCTCDEVASWILRWRSPELKAGWLDGTGVEHVLEFGKLDFTREIKGWIHYAGNECRVRNLDAVTDKVEELWKAYKRL